MATFSVAPKAVSAQQSPVDNSKPTVKLTKREREVLTLVIQGWSSREAAEVLSVQKRQVDFHLANIYDKLGVSNRVQAFRRATRMGLIPYESQIVDAPIERQDPKPTEAESTPASSDEAQQGTANCKPGEESREPSLTDVEVRVLVEANKPSGVSRDFLCTLGRNLVDIHLQEIYRKLDVGDRVSAFDRAIATGLIHNQAGIPDGLAGEEQPTAVDGGAETQSPSVDQNAAGDGSVENDEPMVQVTKREIEVLTLVISGKSNREVAGLLFVSLHTVNFHLANVYNKLHVSNRVQAFRRATRLGLIPYDIQFAD